MRPTGGWSPTPSSTRPDVFVAVDFPDFNFALARALKKRGMPVVYYISPQLWAWRPRRMKTMQRLADRVLVIFPFEEQHLPGRRCAGRVGRPSALRRHAATPAARGVSRRARARSRLGPSSRCFPGSRTNEVREILPDVVRSAAALVRSRVPGVQFVVARAPHLDDGLFEPLQALASDVVDRSTGRADDVLAAADAAVVASGTVTVQAALHECPMVVVYRLSPLTYRLGKPFVHVDTYAMANLVAGRRVVPELIQDAFTPEAVAAEACGCSPTDEYASADPARSA